MKVFISYHRADARQKDKTIKLLSANNIEYYSVPENYSFDGRSHQAIATFLANEIKQCDVLLCIVGKDTYSRPHVDNEIYAALKGAVGVRKGIVAALLENRNDSINSIDFDTFPTKLAENFDYIVLEQFSAIADKKLIPAITQAETNSKNRALQSNCGNPPMQLRRGKYFDNGDTNG